MRRILRGRVLLYTVVLLALVIGLVYSLGQRSVLKIRVERDGRTVARIVETGMVENVYRILLSNADEKNHTISISAHGLNGISIKGIDKVELPALSTQTLALKVQVDQTKARAAGGTSGTNPIEIRLSPIDFKDDVLSEKTIFMLPKQD